MVCLIHRWQHRLTVFENVVGFPIDTLLQGFDNADLSVLCPEFAEAHGFGAKHKCFKTLAGVHCPSHYGWPARRKRLKAWIMHEDVFKELSMRLLLTNRTIDCYLQRYFRMPVTISWLDFFDMNEYFDDEFSRELAWAAARKSVQQRTQAISTGDDPWLDDLLPANHPYRYFTEGERQSHHDHEQIKPFSLHDLSQNASHMHASHNGIAPTITKNCGLLYCRIFSRWLTGRQMLRLMGFPITVDDQLSGGVCQFSQGLPDIRGMNVRGRTRRRIISHCATTMHVITRKSL